MAARRGQAKFRRQVYDAYFIDGKATCGFCKMGIDILRDTWEAAHVVPDAIDGKMVPANGFPAHTRCHQRATAKVDNPQIAKTKRIRAKLAGLQSRSAKSKPLPGSKRSGVAIRMDGTVIDRKTGRILSRRPS
jgi:hypothetical protein